MHRKQINEKACPLAIRVFTYEFATHSIRTNRSDVFCDRDAPGDDRLHQEVKPADKSGGFANRREGSVSLRRLWRHALPRSHRRGSGESSRARGSGAGHRRSRSGIYLLTGDIVYNGYDGNDWKVWDNETSIWRDKKIPVYPALGNHDLHGDETVALGNYFRRFPDLKNSRYYSVRAANALILVLDSALQETGGPEGQWLADKLDHVPSDVDFVFLMFHHPPYTSSSDAKMYGGGHSARTTEQVLAKMLEERQAHARFRIVVFSGHVHNYERHEHGGVTYFVSGGGGAHAYPIERAQADPFQSKQINYHYLLVEVDQQQLKVTMNRLDLSTGTAVWTQPDSIKITVPAPAMAQSAGR